MTMFDKRLLLTFVLAVSVIAAGCGDDGGTIEAVSPVSIGQAEAGLIAFQSCGELETYIKDVAIAEIDKGLDYYGKGIAVPLAGGASGDTAQMSSADGAGGNAEGSPDPSPPADPGSNEEGSKATGTGSGPDFSHTNNQVAGVDEADLVKTDGNFIYVASGSTLRILKSLPAEETEIVSELTLVGGAAEMFLHDDTLLIYGFAYGAKDYDFGGSGKSVAVSSGGSAPTEIPAPPRPSRRCPPTRMMAATRTPAAATIPSPRPSRAPRPPKAASSRICVAASCCSRSSTSATGPTRTSSARWRLSPTTPARG